MSVVPDSGVAQNWLAARHASAPIPAGSEPAMQVIQTMYAMCSVSANWSASQDKWCASQMVAAECSANAQQMVHTTVIVGESAGKRSTNAELRATTPLTVK